MAAGVSLAAVQLAAEGCDRSPEEWPTRGNMVAAAAENYSPLVTREAELFTSMYGDAHVAVRSMSTREAFVALLADSVGLIVVDRLANREEREAMAAQRLSMEEVKLAEDALVLVVHPSNPLRAVSLPQLRRVLQGRIGDWSQLDAEMPKTAVELVMTGRNSGPWELLSERFLPGTQPGPSTLAATQCEVLERVASSPGALGVVSVAAWRCCAQAAAAGDTAAGVNAPGWARGVDPSRDGRVRSLLVRTDQAVGDTVAYAVHQANIHSGAYPLHYPAYVYFEKGARLASGFSAFIASAPGQSQVLRAGLVPATMPVRIVEMK